MIPSSTSPSSTSPSSTSPSSTNPSSTNPSSTNPSSTSPSSAHPPSAHPSSANPSAADPVSGNADPAELAKFASLAQRWWDPNGPEKPLHDLNPLRLQYLERAATLAGSAVLDVGCGGGILSEALARRGARVLGIDLAPALLEVAELHAAESRLKVEYRSASAEALALERPASFDLVTCMEMLEHVPDPAATLRALAHLVRPGGDVVVSTLNRTPRAFLVAILGAEYIARVLPRGTHEYLKFIRPSELARWGRAAGLELSDLTGLSYNPLTRAFRLSGDTKVNYLARFRKGAERQADRAPRLTDESKNELP